jgi:formate dehydrogenase subunit gamma
MQSANVVHAVCALLAIAMSCFHIYLGTIGMKGAYDAMRTGYVDETWAKEHHEIWYEEVKAGESRQHFADEVPGDVRNRVEQAIKAA